MSKKEKVSKVEGSNFDRNEKFTLSNVPKHFESITDQEIKRLKDLAMDEIEQASQFKPGALSDILKSVDGHFESAYSTLEGDYGTRLSNLNEVYMNSLTDLSRAKDAFELQVAEYNNALEKYSEASKTMTGKELPKNLIITYQEIEKIKHLVDRLNERSR